MGYYTKHCDNCEIPHLAHDGECAICGHYMTKVKGGGPCQYEGALSINIEGGYDMFIDPVLSTNKFLICRECAEKFKKNNPALWKKVKE